MGKAVEVVHQSYWTLLRRWYNYLANQAMADFLNLSLPHHSLNRDNGRCACCGRSRGPKWIELVLLPGQKSTIFLFAGASSLTPWSRWEHPLQNLWDNPVPLAPNCDIEVVIWLVSKLPRHPYRSSLLRTFLIFSKCLALPSPVIWLLVSFNLLSFD